MKIQHWLTLILLIALLGSSVYLNVHDNSELESCSEETTAVLIDIYKSGSAGKNFRYLYHVNGKDYTGSQSTIGFDLETFKIGDVVIINYACDEHDISEIVRKR